MAEDSNKSFFQTLPGMMTATATLITAMVGLITVLNQVGLIGDKNKDKPKTEQIADDSNSENVNVANTADLEKIIKKVMAEEKATKGKSEQDIEATVKKIVKDVKKEETSKKTSNETIEKITKAYLSNNKKFDSDEDVYHGEPDDDYGGSYGSNNTGSMVNVSGTWTDSNTGASYVFNQNGNSIAFQEHSINNFGVPIVSAEGSGTISSRNISVNYVTMFNTTGTANMTVSPDGSNITGSFRDNVSGAVMRMNLWR